MTDISGKSNETSQIALNKFYNNLRSTDSLFYGYQFVVEFFGGFFEETENKLQDLIKDQNGSAISYLVQGTSIPDIQLTTGDTSFLGNTFHNPGVLKFQHSWDCSFLLLEDLKPYKLFRHWQTIMSNLNMSGGGYRKISDACARLSILDSSSQAKIRSFVLAGIWPNQIPSISLAYKQGGGEVQKLKVGFKYQYWYRDDAFTVADPLGGRERRLIR